MHDLRRQALESGKTISRKARSKQSSPASSRPNSVPPSRTASRNTSRAGSDEDEGGDLSDETSFRYHQIYFASLRAHVQNNVKPGNQFHRPVANFDLGANHSISVNSIDDVLKSEVEQSTEAWTNDLADRIAEIIDRKRSSIQGRENCLTIYIRILTTQYAEEEIRGKEAELVAAFLKSIKTESSEKETVLAIKGLTPFGLLENKADS